MRPLVKFCGLTRTEDAAAAAELGARYVGAILAPSPRRVDPSHARRLYAAASESGGEAPVGVAVFGDDEPELIASTAEAAGAGVVQLHGHRAAELAHSVGELFDGDVWAVVRVGLASALEVPAVPADGVVFDTADATRLGGTGAPFDWEALAAMLTWENRPGKLVLAGGLRPSNVGGAIRLLLPDVVDVSSGVESSPGIKDHALMRAFVEAVASATER